MVYEEFINYMTDGLQSAFRTELHVEKQLLHRNNGEEHAGLSLVRPDCHISPVIDLTYSWQRYQRGIDEKSILDDMISACRKQLHDLPSFPYDFSDFSEVRPLLVLKLIHHNNNAGLLENTPHRDYLDLAAVCCLFFESANHCLASAVISYDHMNSWNITEDELYAAALENSTRLLPPTLSSMDQLVCEITLDAIVRNDSFPEKDADCPTHMNIAKQSSPAPMYILTNQKKYLGAASLLYPQVPERFARYIKGGFYLLPSSIHEVILIPKNSGADPIYLRNMVRNINQISTSAEEYLSDEIYEYIPEKGLILFEADE